MDIIIVLYLVIIYIEIVSVIEIYGFFVLWTIFLLFLRHSWFLLMEKLWTFSLQINRWQSINISY